MSSLEKALKGELGELIWTHLLFPSTHTGSGTIKPVVFEQLFYSIFSPLGVHSLSKSLSLIWMKRISAEFSSFSCILLALGGLIQNLGQLFQLFQSDLDCAFSNRILFC